MTRIKICGITNREDLLAAQKFGADAVGFILAESPRQIDLKKVEKITEGLSPFISTVAVMVDPSREELEESIESRLFSHIQLHGEKIPPIPENIRTIRALSIKDEGDLSKLEDRRFDYFLLDNGKGGTGIPFDWTILERLRQKRSFILAGGLSTSNLKEAIDRFHPLGVDINSTIEISPGIKDHLLMERIIDLAHGANDGL